MATGPQAVGTSGAGGGGMVPPTFAVPFSFSPPDLGPLAPPLLGSLVPPLLGALGAGLCGFAWCLGIGLGGGRAVTGGCGWLGGSGGSAVVVVVPGSGVVCAPAPGATIAAPTTVAANAALIRFISREPGRRATRRRSSSGSGAPR